MFLDLGTSVLVKWKVVADYGGGGVRTFPDVQVNQQSAELVTVLGVGIDFGGEAGGGAVLRIHYFSHC